MTFVSLLKTIFAALRAPTMPALSDHLRRDIGLPERGQTVCPNLRVPGYNG